MKYMTYTNAFGQDLIVWVADDGGLSFSIAVEGNRVYEEYLAWVAEGNEAEEWKPEGE